MTKWEGKEVSESEYQKLWRAANTEKVKDCHRRCHLKKRKPHKGTFDVSQEEQQRLRKSFESGNWHK